MNINNRTVTIAGYIFTFIVLIGILCVWQPSPPDDFLRHIRYAEYAPHGGYAYMFPYSYFETFTWDPWYGFDRLAGFLKTWVGSSRTVLLYQVTFVSLFCVGMVLNLRSRADHFLLHMMFLFVLLSLVINRLVLIRPCILMAVIFFLAIPGKRFWSGLLACLVGAMFYYLFFLYTVPLAIAHYFKGSRKFSYGLALGTLLSLAGWMVLTNFGLLSILAHTVRALLSSRDGLVVVENTLSIDQIERVPVYLIVFFFLLTFHRYRTLDIYAALLLATAPLALQARYFADLTLPLMVIYTLNNNEEMYGVLSRNKPVFEAFALVSILLVVPGLQNVSLRSPYTSRLDGLDLPMGARVFAANGFPDNFSAVFWNRTPIRVIPSSEIGWNDKETLGLIREITRDRSIPQRFCDYAVRHRIDYVLSESPSSAACLTLVRSFTKGKRIDLFRSTVSQHYRDIYETG
jgi:hypothetical protein